MLKIYNKLEFMTKHSSVTFICFKVGGWNQIKEKVESKTKLKSFGEMRMNKAVDVSHAAVGHAFPLRIILQLGEVFCNELDCLI